MPYYIASLNNLTPVAGCEAVNGSCTTVLFFTLWVALQTHWTFLVARHLFKDGGCGCVAIEKSP